MKIKRAITIGCWMFGCGARTGLIATEPLEDAGPDAGFQLSAGDLTTCVNRNGDVWCWGFNDDGYVGVAEAGVSHGDAGPFVNIPVRVPLPEKVDEIAAGTTTVVRVGDRVRSWAGGTAGDGAWVGNGLQGPSPPVLLELGGVTRFSRHALATQDVCCQSRGDWLCWGGNALGQLTFPDSDPFPLPTKIDALAGAEEVAEGEHLTCGRWATGEVRCAGRNDVGQLGAGTISKSRYTLEPVVGLSDAAQVTAGSAHVCARRRDGKISCWGYNQFGEMGDGTTSPPPYARPTPSHVAGIVAARLVVAGSGHTCAITADDRVTCWGWNDHGQLGDGTRTDRASPVAVVGLSGVEQLDLGVLHSCALTRAGALYCWGHNGAGELGDGTFEDRLVPTPVKLPP